MRIKIIFRALVVDGELDESETARKIFLALPIEGKVNRWGDEIYFEIPVNAELGINARADMEIGELGYWPEGRSFCIFFGPTPASKNEKPRAYSDVNVIGRLLDTPVEKLKAIKRGTWVRIEKA